MPKYFLYIDESKDFKNHTIYIGGLVSVLWLSAFEKFCKKCVPDNQKKELKSTQDFDRVFFEELTQKEWLPFSTQVEKLTSHSDHDYLDNLITFVELVLQKLHQIDAVHIIADFTRLSSDMEKTERSFSKKLTHLFQKPITLEFKNSSQYRCIQFADLAVWSFRKQKKSSVVCASQSESKTSLHTTSRNL